MDTCFNIYHLGEPNERPPISYKIKEYFTEFVTENVLKTKRIIIGGKWKVCLSLHFMSEGARFTTSDIFMAKSPTSVQQDSVKIYFITIPMKAIVQSQSPYQKTIELIYEAITKYFTSTYKKVTREFMADLMNQVNFDYLFSLPYPAPFNEQQFLLDQQMYVEESDGSVRPKTLEEQARFIGNNDKILESYP